MARYLVGLKLYMGLETSFGKSIESVVLPTFPSIVAGGDTYWDGPVEKLEEFATYAGLSRAAKQQARSGSVWREIDCACISGATRHLLTIKSGTSTINDSQVDAMTKAIVANAPTWLAESKSRYNVDDIVVTIGLTYGTPAQTNNKDIQILNKLLGLGYVLVDGEDGVIRSGDGRISVVRRIVTE